MSTARRYHEATKHFPGRPSSNPSGLEWRGEPGLFKRGAPEPNAVGEGRKGGELCALDGGEEAAESALGLMPVARSIDRAKASLSAQASAISGWLEQRDQAAPLALCEPLPGLQQAVAGAVEVLAPAGALARTSRPLGPTPAVPALALAADGVEGGVGAAHQVEVVDHDPRPRQRVADRPAVGLVGVDRDDLDRFPLRLRQRAQVALHTAAAAAVEHVHDAPAVQVGATVASSRRRRWWASSSDSRRAGRVRRRASSSSSAPARKARATW
jgi:hypothetical protein